MTKGRDYRSAKAQPHNAWYNLAAWKGPNGRRLTQLAKEPLCRMCKAATRTTAATVADHITPHRGDERLFWEGELQSLCKEHHDGAKQAEDIRGYDKAVDNDGWPVDPRHPANR